MTFLDRARALHDRVFDTLEAATQGWFMGLFARFAFASALFVFLLHSATTKVGSGFPGALGPVSNAYPQMLPSIAEKYGYSALQIPFIPYGAIAYAGTYAEFILPVLFVLGLFVLGPFTRVASLGMIGFIFAMSWVDIAGHAIDAKIIGSIFDRIQNSVIADQRLLWLMPLVHLMVKGAGAISLDRLLQDRRQRPDA